MRVMEFLFRDLSGRVWTVCLYCFGIRRSSGSHESLIKSNDPDIFNELFYRRLAISL